MLRFSLVPGRDNYAVVGNPVAHSKSPRIHSAFADETGEPVAYQAIPVEPGGFKDALGALQRSGLRGLNVTLPFKEDAYRAARWPTARAQQAGAANTLWFDGAGDCHADNTDGVGLVRDLARNLGVELAGRRVLIAGAGGSVRGILGSLLDEKPAHVMIVNRGMQRARDLAGAFASLGPVGACGYEDTSRLDAFDLILNATSLSLQGMTPALDPRVIGPSAWCYDLMYADEPTPFMRWGLGHGASRVADGLGMLVEQAAESFEIWRGIRPSTAPVIKMLRNRPAYAPAAR